MSESKPHWSLVYFQGWFLAIPVSAGVGFGFVVFISPLLPWPDGHGLMSQLPYLFTWFAFVLVPIILIRKFFQLRRKITFSIAALIFALPLSFLMVGRYVGAN